MGWLCNMSKPSEETKRKISESVKRRWMICILDYIEKGGGYIG